MNDQVARIAALEERVAYLERTQEQLSDALAAARAEIDRLTRRLLRIESQMKDLSPGAAGDAADEPPPPHY